MSSSGGDEHRDVAGAGLDHVTLQEVRRAVVGVEVVGRLALAPAPDADDAPAAMVVDRRRLAGLPDERHDRIAALRMHVDEVLPVAVGRRLAVTLLEQRRVGECRAQQHPDANGDRMRIVVRRDDRVERPGQAAKRTRPADGARVVDELKSVIGHTASVRCDRRLRIGRKAWFRSSVRTNSTRT